MARRNVKALRKRQEQNQSEKSIIQNQSGSSNVDSVLFTAFAFQLLASVRLAAALFSPISDCDEVYNYWEPLHFLLYGGGFQTWEYSPLYAIRSYAYILLHYVPARLVNFFSSDPKLTFFLIRCLLSFICACSDLRFYSSVRRKFGVDVGRITLAFQVLGAGYFVSCAAFLPSTFSMVMTSFAYAYWMESRDFLAVLFIAISALLGWPFAALLGVPIAVDMVFIPTTRTNNSSSTTTSRRPATTTTRRWKVFLLYSVISGTLIGASMLICDTAFYGKSTLAPFNIIHYNIFTPHGPDLYGVAPLSYYIVNLFLNWNVAIVLAATALPLTAVLFWREYDWKMRKTTTTRVDQLRQVMLVQLGFWLWLITFFCQPHKEERFLYPVYPLLCVSAGVTLDAHQRSVSTVCKPIRRIARRWGPVAANAPALAYLLVFAILSISRSVGQYRNFYAPLDVYDALQNRIALTTVDRGNNIAANATAVVDVCVGKEWYRYPSSFFLPQNAELRFVKSQFAGLLPKPYPSIVAGAGGGVDWKAMMNATRSVPTEMNDMNKEEMSRYVDIDACDYLIDLDTGEEVAGELEPNYSRDNDTWAIVTTRPFLISDKSNRLFRAFYVPILTDWYCEYGRYNLLERKSVQ